LEKRYSLRRTTTTEPGDKDIGLQTQEAGKGTDITGDISSESILIDIDYTQFCEGGEEARRE